MTIENSPQARPAAPVPRILLYSLLLLLGACAHEGGVTRQRSAAGRAVDSITANGVLIRAIGLVGTPYRYGGNTPEGGFDCSGLVTFVYRDSAGIGLPRSSRDLAAMDVPKVARKRLASGDLVFFGAGDVSHVGIYVGENRFVHAPNSGGTVRLDTLDGAYWKDRYLFARRVLR